MILVRGVINEMSTVLTQPLKWPDNGAEKKNVCGACVCVHVCVIMVKPRPGRI